ncbi:MULTISPECIES: RNA polymerase sigma-70 factor [unclassified Paenibacillus]|uniref:RNA polymerase sigma-70 factor n=1 Tax=unclassified Paenibacillus TaxID=185978 RepID=UPI002377D3CB|nr:RNA polymerase sigma-70 factor [Paenibacillus sp. MAHUQ-63]
MEEIYRTYHKLLFAVAYRMLGSEADAEDILQEIYMKLPSVDLASVDNLKAYLVKMVTNRCLNVVKLARKTREVYVGPWLPEPQIQNAAHDPMRRIEQDETVNYAFLVLLQKLTATERAVFILREALGYEYAEIADMLHKSEDNCRKIFSRAKSKVAGSGERSSDPAGDTEPLARLFMRAVSTGNFTAFVSMLTDEAVLISDGGGKRRAAIHPIIGKLRIQAFFQGIVAKGSLQGEWLPVRHNGQDGLLLVQDREPVKFIAFHLPAQGQQAAGIYMIVNPDKLQNIFFSLTCHKTPS